MAEKSAAGESVYNRIKNQLKGQEGKIVAIDTETGEFFVGNTVIEASRAGQAKYPKKEFYFKRVGSKAAFVIGALHA
jgi:hypothetical protein